MSFIKPSTIGTCGSSATVPGCSSTGLCTATDGTCAKNDGNTQQNASAIAQMGKATYSK